MDDSPLHWAKEYIFSLSISPYLTLLAPRDSVKRFANLQIYSYLQHQIPLTVSMRKAAKRDASVISFSNIFLLWTFLWFKFLSPVIDISLESTTSTKYCGRKNWFLYQCLAFWPGVVYLGFKQDGPEMVDVAANFRKNAKMRTNQERILCRRKISWHSLLNII
jgi:hypothetical protein